MGTADKGVLFEDLRLEQAVFEVRYPLALTFWDVSGAIWSRLQEHWPGLSVGEIEPNRTRFRLGDSGEVGVELSAYRYIAHLPERSLKTFREHCIVLNDVVQGFLAPKRLERLGLRLMYSKDLATREAASDMLFRTGVLSVPTSITSHLSANSRLLFPEAAFRVEGNTIGTSYRIKVETRSFEIQVPPGVEIPAVKEEKHRIVCDIDYYTTAHISPSKLSVSDWIQSGLRTIRRDGDRLLAGDHAI